MSDRVADPVRPCPGAKAKPAGEGRPCEDCDDRVTRRTRCPRCRRLVCRWCRHHVHNHAVQTSPPVSP